jgi:hypothetical protein
MAVASDIKPGRHDDESDWGPRVVMRNGHGIRIDGAGSPDRSIGESDG